MEYTILGIILMVIMLLYFMAADHFNIIDKPNQRSSHTEITLRGGGIIFWFSALLYFVQHIQNNYFFFIHKVKNKIIKIIGNSKIKPINLFLTKKYFITSKKSLMTIVIYPYIKLKL